jgi:hypothetical protein
VHLALRFLHASQAVEMRALDRRFRELVFLEGGAFAGLVGRVFVGKGIIVASTACIYRFMGAM